MFTRVKVDSIASGICVVRTGPSKFTETDDDCDDDDDDDDSPFAPSVIAPLPGPARGYPRDRELEKSTLYLRRVT